MDLTVLLRGRREHLERFANTKGSEGERTVLNEQSEWLPRPNGKGRDNLMAALKSNGVQIRPSSFDAIALPPGVRVDLEDPEAVRRMLPLMVFVEIKTANQERVRPGFKGYFFALTESEIEAAHALGERHRVLLYNKRTGETRLTSVPELLGQSTSRTWQLSIQL